MDATLSEDVLHEDLLSGDPTKQVCIWAESFSPLFFSSHFSHTTTQVEAIQKIIRLADEGNPINVNWPVFFAVCITNVKHSFHFLLLTTKTQKTDVRDKQRPEGVHGSVRGAATVRRDAGRVVADHVAAHGESVQL